MKIAILGYSGSGKSTLARHLGRRYLLPVLHLDTVQFLPGWQERNREEAVSKVAEFMEQDCWVIDGNYRSFLQQKRLNEADHIIFMNFNRLACLGRALRRYFQYRGSTRECMADGCAEKFDFEFLWWILYRGRTKKIRAHFCEICKGYQRKIVIIKNQRQLNSFMEHPFE